jgi:hypothetical protein
MRVIDGASMSSSVFRITAAAAVAAMTGLTGTARAQNVPPALEGSSPTANMRPPAPIAGTWSGTVIQVQRSIEYGVSLDIAAQRAEINYPGLNCGGTLKLVGASAKYVLFVETITRGPAHDDDGLCWSGTITIARTGDKLAWAWFGLVREELVTAYGWLKKQGEQSEGKSITGSTSPPIPLPRERARRRSAAPSAPPR